MKAGMENRARVVRDLYTGSSSKRWPLSHSALHVGLLVSLCLNNHTGRCVVNLIKGIHGVDTLHLLPSSAGTRKPSSPCREVAAGGRGAAGNELFHCGTVKSQMTCLFRYNALSLVYLLYLLLLPWFLWPNKHTLRGHTGRFIKALFSTSLLFLLAHVCFQICLYTVPDLDYALGHNCSSWDTLARHIGMSRLPLDKPWTVVRLLAPDLGIFIISLITMVLCNRLVKSREEGTTAHSSTLNQEADERRLHASAFTFSSDDGILGDVSQIRFSRMWSLLSCSWAAASHTLSLQEHRDPAGRLRSAE
ncbi:hypothetical protein SRHO_G00304380 [Serrasalmus rhombeus]